MKHLQHEEEKVRETNSCTYQGRGKENREKTVVVDWSVSETGNDKRGKRANKE